MTEILEAFFATRRGAEMVVEHLVQEYGLAPSAVAIRTDTEENSSGTKPAGGDLAEGQMKPQEEGNPRLEGKLIVSARVDPSGVDKVRSTFSNYGGQIASDSTTKKSR